MNRNLVNLLIFVVLCIIWGSSFILMKEGMSHKGVNTLTPFQVAAIRLFSAGIILLPFGISALKKFPRNKIGLMILSGLLGSFFPAFLFCESETKIDSSLAGCLNALTPIFTIVVGILFFKTKVQWRKILGVSIAFAGSIFLMLSKQRNIAELDSVYFFYAMLAVIATISYGFNVNLLGKHLKEIGSFNIAAVAFSFLTIPSATILLFTGFHHLPLNQFSYLWSIGASSLLGIFGTAVASILFYVLIKRTGTLFASTVTYGIPFVAFGWGMFAGEFITIFQMLWLAVILVGVYITNKN